MTCEPPGPVQGHARGGCLLQRLVGKQPTGDPQLPQPARRAAAQQRRLHQHGGPITEPGAHRGDIGDPGGVGQFEFGDRRERRGTRFRPQVTNVGRAEAQPRAQNGLTPVIITL
jgi:hypothetical protein